MTKKILGIAAFFLIVGSLKYFGVLEHLNLESLKNSKDQLVGYKEAHPVLSLFLFFSLYVFNCAFALPGAAVLSLSAGAIFGLPVGIVLVSLSSVAGAAIAFQFARLLFRDWVQNKFKVQLVDFHARMDKEGVYYLLFLRLVPVFPFFLVNLLLSQTKIALSTFLGVSWIAMLPATVIYVNAGTQLSKIQSTKDILDPLMIGSFVLLGLFPLLAKKAMEWFSEKQKNGKAI